MNFHLPLLLLSLVVFPTLAYIRQEKDPKTIAKDFQAVLNRLVALKNRQKITHLFADNFVYEGCRGEKMDYDKFTDLLLVTPSKGSVTEARADGIHVIYRVRYQKRVTEIMITRNQYGWKMSRAQSVIC